MRCYLRVVPKIAVGGGGASPVPVQPEVQAAELGTPRRSSRARAADTRGRPGVQRGAGAAGQPGSLGRGQRGPRGTLVILGTWGTLPGGHSAGSSPSGDPGLPPARGRKPVTPSKAPSGGSLWMVEPQPSPQLLPPDPQPCCAGLLQASPGHPSLLLLRTPGAPSPASSDLEPGGAQARSLNAWRPQPFALGGRP